MSIFGRIVAAAQALGLAPRAELVVPQAAPAAWWRSMTATAGQAQGLTPGRLRAMIDEADAGYPAELLQLVAEMSDRDLHLVAVTNTRRNAVAGLPWCIEPASDDAADVEVAQWVDSVLRRAHGLHTLFAHLMGGVVDGVAAAEIDWTVRGVEVVPAAFLARPSWWMRPGAEGDWMVTTAATPGGEPLVAGRWVVHAPVAKAGVGMGAALGRVLAWCFLWKVYVLKDWVAYSERFGSPFRLGKYPATSSSEDIDRLATALEQLGIDAWAAIPDDMAVEFVGDAGAKTGTPTYQALLTYIDEQVSKATLGQTLTTQASSTGTQALGTVQNEVRLDIRNSDALQLGESITRCVVAPLVELNRPGRRAPVFRFVVEAPADQEAAGRVKEARLRVFQGALDLGVSLSVAQVREELGLRAPAAGEAVLLPALPMSTQPVVAQARPAGCTVCGHAHGQRVVGAVAGTPVAQLEAELARARPLLGAAWADLVDRAVTALRDVQSSGETSEIVRSWLTNLRSSSMSEYPQVLARMTIRLEALGHLQVSRATDSRVDLPSSDPLDPAAAGDWAPLVGDESDAWAARVDTHLKRATETAQWATLSATRDLAAATAGPDEGRADRLLEAGARAATDPHRVDAVADAAGSVAWQRGRAVQQQREADRRPYLRYRTMRDDRVRDAHKAMEGWLALASAPIWQTWRPPNGWGCRCWLEAWRADEVAAKGWSIRRPDELPRNADGGPLAPDAGWARDHLRSESEYDWSAFPADWRRAIGAPEPT